VDASAPGATARHRQRARVRKRLHRPRASNRLLHPLGGSGAPGPLAPFGASRLGATSFFRGLVRQNELPPRCRGRRASSTAYRAPLEYASPTARPIIVSQSAKSHVANKFANGRVLPQPCP